MLILVTGATGFIGRHLVASLMSAGYSVRALVRDSSNISALEDVGINIIHGSQHDPISVAQACDGVDIIINLTGKTGGPTVNRDDLWATNVTAAERLIDACQAGVTRQFIHCSTPGVVGMVGVAPECMPYRPNGLYERTKCEGEKVVLRYHAVGKVPVTIVRPDFVYGPGDHHKLKMFKAVDDRTFRVIGRGSALIHPTYVEDVVCGIMLTIDNPAAHGQVFNIAGPRPVSVLELVTEMAGALGVAAPSRSVSTAAAKIAAVGAEITGKVFHQPPFITRYQVDFFTRDHASDTSKAEKMLGFVPKVGLREGLRRTVEWYKQTGVI